MRIGLRKSIGIHFALSTGTECMVPNASAYACMFHDGHAHDPDVGVCPSSNWRERRGYLSTCMDSKHSDKH
eukprot:9427295-Alexandrium_andersonii.AAC.1